MKPRQDAREQLAEMGEECEMCLLRVRGWCQAGVGLPGKQREERLKCAQAWLAGSPRPTLRRDRREGPPLGKAQLGEGVPEPAAAHGAAGSQALHGNNFVSNKCFGSFS